MTSDVELKSIQEVADVVATHTVRTPLNLSQTLSEMCGASIHLKLENMQFTSSFKERGVVAKLNSLTSSERHRGVIAMSAGNHAQALARHARILDVHSTLVMPRNTPVSKIQKTKFFEPEVVLTGETFEETIAFVNERVASQKQVLIHPFDDPQVIAGQGTLGLEILDQLPDVETIVVPIGGGGLISGISVAVKQSKPDVRVIGVQSELFSATHDQFKNRVTEQQKNRISIAEGIAVKQPGELTSKFIEKYVDDIVIVKERDIETAIFNLLDIEKTLAEGAGAVALAAVFIQPEVARGKTVCVISGGNIDPITLSSVVQRNLVRTAHIVRLHVTIQDVPGALAKLAQEISDMDSNIVDVYHRRSFGNSTLDATLLELTIQLRGSDDKQSVVQQLSERGYEVREATG